jgi:hypothetical protein
MSFQFNLVEKGKTLKQRMQQKISFKSFSFFPLAQQSFFGVKIFTYWFLDMGGFHQASHDILRIIIMVLVQ